uniref:Myomesin 2a n=1 Tax=Sinocyclocheilus grahami TaxID=75366 RepID=A0A672SKX3_SINGR
MPARGVTLYRQEQTQHQSSKHVVQHSRKSSSQVVKKEQVQATKAMAEQAYTVPTFRERAPEGMQEYQRMAAHFGRDLVQLQHELHRMKVATKEQVDNIEITREVKGMMPLRKDYSAEVPKAPNFLVSLRSHTMWEKTPVKLFCTVSGKPNPIVKWYRNNVAIEPLSAPGKYKIENKYGVHSLIISRCAVTDSGIYSAVATNPHGKATSKATVCVRSECVFFSPHIFSLSLLVFRWSFSNLPCLSFHVGPLGGGELSHLPGQVPLLSGIHPSKLEVTLLESFGVTFGTEGESVSLVANMVVVPDLPNLPPEAMWYRDDTLLMPSRWAEMSIGGGVAKLTLPHLNKDDEGLYTLRIWTKDGTAEHSAYLFVKDATPTVAGAPGAPMDVAVFDVNADYVLVSWKPPNTTHEAPITGYFVDRRKSGTKDWVQCNDSSVKVCKLPVHGLTEGASYHFRVRAVNKDGISLPSRMSSGVTAAEVESDVEGVPSAPGQVIASRNTKTSTFVQWQPPKHANNLMGYYVDASLVGSKKWFPCNHRPYKHTRFVVHGLVPGDTYVFRVQAVNAYGLSDESQDSAPLFIDAALSTPSAPYGISLLNCNGSSMTLAWKRPKNTGGSKITSYYLDKREAESVDWKEVSPSPAAHRTFTVENLTTGVFYEFKIQAANLAGVGLPSEPSKAFACEAWTMAEPGPAYDISFWEVRDTSVLVQWKPPVYAGAGPITGYFVDMAKKGSSDFVAVNAEPVGHCYLKVSGLDTGASYVFRVRAVNAKDVGKASDVSDPVCAKVLPGNCNTALLPTVSTHQQPFFNMQHIGFVPNHISFLIGTQKMFMEANGITFHCMIKSVKETAFTWFKDDEEIPVDVPPNPMSGSCSLPIPMFSRKDQGIYKAVLGDDRGKDTSVYDISGKVFEDIINAIASIAGSSASDLVLQCTPEGIRLQCYMKYYTEEMKTSWFHRDSKISSSEKMRIGGTSEMAWMQICEPTDKEKGHYTIEIHDGKKSHSRTFDLSGQGNVQMCYMNYLLSVDRGRVVGGLPDVVTIMEKKSLSLTCTVRGDPSPEVTWFKNEQEVVSDDRYKITFEGGKFASLTINNVYVEDSGKYSINVRNKYGGEFVEITVSVYKQGGDIPEPKLGQMSKPTVTPKPATPAPQSVKTPTPPTPTPSVKSPTPTPPPSVKSPTPTPAPKSPTPPRSMRSPTPPRSMRSPTPTKK